MAKYEAGRQRSSGKHKVQQAWASEARRAGRARLRPARQPAGISGRALVYMVCIGLLLGWYGPDWIERLDQPMAGVPLRSQSAVVPADNLSAAFGFCHSGGVNCVVDGDTFRFHGEKIRIADIDTPETHGPRCAAEGELGAQATRRLQTLMNEGPFSLESGDRDTDRYGRTLRVVTRKGQSIGNQLVTEGLARHWDGARRPWC